MNITCEFFLEAPIETQADLKKVIEFNPNIKTYRNAFYIERNGMQEKVVPKSFNVVKEIKDGINTIDFFSKNLLKEMLKSGILNQVIRFETNIGIKKSKGYILEVSCSPNEDLKKLYEQEVMEKAKKYFEV